MGTATLQRAEIASGADTIWTIDPLHSTIAFSIKHMKVATVHGRFGSFHGTIRFDPDRPAATSVDVQIDPGSIDTREKRRDDHLRSADFFDVAAYPAITFRSTRVEPLGPMHRDHWRLVGDLTIHGVTLPVELAVKQAGDGPNPWNTGVMSFTATTTISRKAFGVGDALALDGGGLLIADQVAIAIAIQALSGAIDGR